MKTKKKAGATEGQRIVDYVLGYVAAAGVIEGRRPNKRVVFTGVHFNSRTGECRSVYEKLVEDIDELLAKRKAK